jgi:putative ABC transport system ATP-binding protein
MTHLVEAHNLVRRFGKKGAEIIAVDDISLTVSARELVVLMGPSGSGKTTLLAMLGCLLQPSSGSIRILGQEMTTLSAGSLAKLRGESIGFVFQGFNLLSGLSAWENVALATDFASRRSRHARTRAIEMLEGIGLGNRIDHLPADLSAGEKQRVAFARALINNPQIVLADEPTANLDAANRDILAGLLRQAVDRRNIGVIIATHDERIRHLADRSLRIEDGRLRPVDP